MPYTTNLKHTGQGGQHEYTRAKLDTTATVYFGNRGELDYHGRVVICDMILFKSAMSPLHSTKALLICLVAVVAYPIRMQPMPI